MKETVIQLRSEQEKITALRIYLAEKEGGIEKELTDYVESLYRKYVPANVREYIEKVDAQEGETASSPPRRVMRRKPVSADPPDNGTDNTDRRMNAPCGANLSPVTEHIESCRPSAGISRIIGLFPGRPIF